MPADARSQLSIPVLAVLGNHDVSRVPDRVSEILSAVGVRALDGDACVIGGVGCAGMKGFGGLSARGLDAILWIAQMRLQPDNHLDTVTGSADELLFRCSGWVLARFHREGRAAGSAALFVFGLDDPLPKIEASDDLQGGPALSGGYAERRGLPSWDSCMATHFRGTSPGSVRVSDATSQTVRSIGIFGHYANTNLGDEAIIEAVLTNLRQRLPHATFYAFSRDPVDSEKRYGVPAFSIGRGFVVVRSELDENLRPAAPVPDPTERDDGGGPSVRELLKRIPGLRPAVLLSRMLVTGLRNAGPELRCCWASARVLRNVDLLIVTGSNQFLDNFGGSAAYPFTLLKWAVLCWLTGTKLCFASVGAGPLDAKLSKFLVRLALLFSSYTSFRDENSMKLIHALGARKSTLVFPDLAHSLAVDFPADRPRAARIDGQKPTIAINPMPMYDSRYWCEPDDSRYLDYVDELAKASSQLLRDGYPLFFFGTQSMDENVIADVVERLDADVAEDFDVARQFKRSQTVQELMAIITSADIVVPTRFHGTVLSLHAARGVVAICYYRKTHDIMREMGQGAYALDFDGLCADQLVERVKHLEANLDDATRVIRERDDAYQRALDQQYANLVELAQRG